MNLQQVEYKKKPRSISSSVDQHIAATTRTRTSFENDEDEHNQEQRRNMTMTMTMEDTNQYCSSLSGGEEFLSLNDHAGGGGGEGSGKDEEESWMGLDKTRHERKKNYIESKSATVAAAKKKKEKKKSRSNRSSSSRHYHQTMKGMKGLENDCFSIESASTISSLEVDLSDAEEVNEEAVMPFRQHHRRSSSKNCPVVMRKSERRNSLPAGCFPSSSPDVLGGDDDHNDFSRFDALSKSERYADSLPELPADLDGSFRGTGLSSPRERAGCGTAAATTSTSTRMMMMKQQSCIFSRRSSVDGAMGGMLSRSTRNATTTPVPNDLPVSDKDLQVMDLLSSNIKESRWQSGTTASTMGGNGSSTLNGCSSSGCILQQQQRSSSGLSSPHRKESSPDLLANDVQKRLSLSSSERGRIIQQQNLPLVPPKRKPVLDSEEV